MRIQVHGARKALIVGSAAILLAVSSGVVNVLAVHDVDMELDGNIVVNGAADAQPYDWASIFTSAGANQDPLPTGFTAATFTSDFETTTKKGATVFATHDATTFATGSKDTLDINPGWQCTASNNVLSKNDIMNAYATAFTDPATGKQFMYFALERNSNNGDANVAFWFLQSDATCDSSNGTATWSGHHTDGDLLVVSAFTNGGGVSNVTAYRWNGGANGSLGTTPVANGGDCQSALGGDAICATTNGSAAPGLDAAISTPWLTANADDNVGHTLQPSEFFEGGIDLTATGFANKCFNTFVGDTRSSQSLTATIFDYARGLLGECNSTTATNPVDPNDHTVGPASSIPEAPADAKVDVQDKTVIDVTGINTFSGSITWYLCGATAASSTATCDSGGVNVGSQNITVDGTYYSPTATVTAAGRYCFRAEFSGDTNAGVPGSSDHDSSECFVVSPVQSQLATTAGAGPVDFGQAVTDSATLSHTANQPGTGGPSGATPSGSINPTTLGGSADGTITFTLYKDDCTTQATGTGTNPQTKSVSGSGSYGPVSFTPDAPGTYHWVASYDGDSPNTLGTTHNADCSDSNETVVVRQIPTEIATTPTFVPNDSATVTSSVSGNNLPADGTVTFSLYGPGGGTTALLNCQAGGTTGRLYTKSFLTGAAAHSQTVATDNTTAVSSDATYYWLVTYDPGDTAHTGRQSSCNEVITVDLTGDSGPGTLYPAP